MGAFQYLERKQRKHDAKRKDWSVSTELAHLLSSAKSILCDIETAINNTKLAMPRVLTRKGMEQELHFRNNKRSMADWDYVDDLDVKFTKTRFLEYLAELQRVLKRPRKKPLVSKAHVRKRGKAIGGKRNVTEASIGDAMQGETTGTGMAASGLLAPHRRKKHRHVGRQNGTAVARPQHRGPRLNGAHNGASLANPAAAAAGQIVPRRRGERRNQARRNQMGGARMRNHRRKNLTTTVTPTTPAVDHV